MSGKEIPEKVFKELFKAGGKKKGKKGKKGKKKR